MNIRNGIVLIICLASLGIAQFEEPLFSLWPSLVALVSVVLLKSALGGLFLGAGSGVILMAGGNPLHAVTSFFSKILIPALSSEWNLSVLAFTLLLGGFAALLEKGGGFDCILQAWLRQGKNLSQKVQWSAFLMGVVCFFDGLASALLTGRALRQMADRTGVSRAKLAYLVDSTGSAVACVAIMSTWIAYQFYFALFCSVLPCFSWLCVLLFGIS